MVGSSLGKNKLGVQRDCTGFPGGSVVKNLPAMQATQERQFRSLGQEDPLEEEMAAHSSILAWEIPWTEEPQTATVHGFTKSWTQLTDSARGDNTVLYIPGI